MRGQPCLDIKHFGEDVGACIVSLCCFQASEKIWTSIKETMLGVVTVVCNDLPPNTLKCVSPPFVP